MRDISSVSLALADLIRDFLWLQAQWRRLVRRYRLVYKLLTGGVPRDGDMYSLIWDPRLLIKEVHEPMDYTGPVPYKCSSPVTLDQIKEVV